MGVPCSLCVRGVESRHVRRHVVSETGGSCMVAVVGGGPRLALTRSFSDRFAEGPRAFGPTGVWVTG